MTKISILKTAVKFGMRRQIAVLPPQESVIQLEPQLEHVDAGYSIKLSESEKREVVTQILALPKEVDGLVRHSIELDAQLHSANLNQQTIISKIHAEPSLSKRIAILAPKGDIRLVLNDRSKVRTIANALNPGKYERALMDRLEAAYGEEYNLAMEKKDVLRALKEKENLIRNSELGIGTVHKALSSLEKSHADNLRINLNVAKNMLDKVK